MKKILLFILLLVPNILFAQNILVKGVVFDENKTTVPGASIVEVGTKNGTNTDLQGGFSLEVKPGSLLEVSFIGYSSQRVKATSQMSVFLVPETTSLEDVVVVGYRTVKKESLTGAVANITNKDIVSTKSSNLAVDLAGKVAGFNIRQRNGQPGLFATDINIRGMGSPLFIIDGIVRDGATEFQRLNPEDIESISFLKDGTAAIYGMNSSNGAVIVTTKTGGNRKPEITFSSNVGFASPTYMPKMCNAAQWYELMVDGQVNIGNSPYITSSELEAWRSGAEGHQSYDYYDALFKNFSIQQQNTVSVTGGNARTSYFASIAYSNDDGLLKKGGTSYNQYSIRSNVKTKITDNLTANINMYGMRGTREQGFMNYQNVFFVSIVEPPITPIYANNNDNYYNNFTYGINPVAGSDRSTSGYDKLDNKSFQSLLSLDYSAPFLTGLDLKAQLSYDFNYSDTKILGKQFNTWTYDSGTDSYTSHLINSPSQIKDTKADDDRLDYQLSANFNRKFAENHNVGVVLVFEGKKITSSNLYGSRYYDFYSIDDLNYGRTDDMTNNGGSSEGRYLSYIGRFNYDYAGKYLAEFACRYDGSYRYSPKGRWAFFPMGSLGWKVSDEPFIKNNLPYVTGLKLRASVGSSGQDAGEPFQYLEGYQLNQGGAVLSQNSFTTGVSTPVIANENLTWYTSTMYDVGLDLSLWKGIIGAEFDMFRRNRSGLLSKKNVALPNTFGAELPEENLNKDRTDGIELTLSHSYHFGDFFYNVKANMCYSRTKTIYAEESSFNSSWDRWRNQATGRYQNVVWGYSTDGRFLTDEDLSTRPIQDGTVGNDKELPGDYVIKDVNGDGHIDAADMMPEYWGSTPLINYGLSLSGSWRGFDFSALLQGAGFYTARYMDCYGVMLYQLGNTPAYFLDRWHYADPYDETSGWVAGKWPAIRPDGYAGCLYYNTDVWRRNSTYLRLKSVEIGYTISPKVLKKTGIKSVRVYANGNNLFTICDSFLKSFDPEKSEGDYSAGITYPLTKCYNFGINLTF